MANLKAKYKNEVFFNKKLLAVMCSLSMSGMAIAADTAKKDDALEEIVITARQQAMVNADERKQKAESSIDSIVADDAGKLPDSSITEVLQRVSGVSIVRFGSLSDPDHFSAQGTGIQVRGLSGVAGRVNGREVFSSNNGRGLSWSDVTPEMMAAVDVYKSSTADLIEGGTGGQIDLRTKMPFDYHDGFKAQVTASASYGDLTDGGPTPSGSFLITDRFDTDVGEFGVLLDLAKSKFKSHDDFVRMEPFYKTRLSDGTDKYIPGGYDYGSDDYERNRTGAYLALQWAPSDEFKISQTVFMSKYTDETLASGEFVTSKDLAVDPSVSTFSKNGILLSSDKIFMRNNSDANAWSTDLGSRENETLYAGGNTAFSAGESKTRDISTSFEWKPSEQFLVKGSVQAVQSTGESHGYNVFSNSPFAGYYGLDMTGKLPSLSVPQATLDKLTNRDLYQWLATMDNIGDSEGTMHAANVDVNYVISEDEFFRSAQVGGRYADRTEHDNNSLYNWTAMVNDWGGGRYNFNESQVTPGDVELREYKNFFRGDVKLPGAVYKPSFAMVTRYDPVADHQKYANDSNGKASHVNAQGENFDADAQENTNKALYALIRFASDNGIAGIPYSGNLGVRYVHIDSSSRGFYKQNKAQFLRDGVETNIPELGEARKGEATFDRLLPSINIKLDPSEKVNVRFGYNETLDQPGFYQTKASGSTSVRAPTDPNASQGALGTFEGFDSNAGNPLLKPVISHNTDLSVEWYPSSTTSGHISLFHKSIDNWFTYGNASIPVPITWADGTTTMEIASKTDTFNSDKTAKIKGFEVGGHTFFSSLPSPWNGLGIDANYTYIDSKNPGDQYIDINGVKHFDAPVQGLSRHSANFALMYEKDAISLRLAYNWRSKYLMGTHGNGTDGDYNYHPQSGTNVFTDISLANFADAYGQVDLGGTYKFNDKASFSLQVSNLTNATTKTLQYGYPGDEFAPRSWFMADRRLEAIIRYDF